MTRFFSVLVFAGLLPTLSAQITITKTIDLKQRNPTVRLDIDDPQLDDGLRNNLLYSGWFEVLRSADTDWLISGSVSGDTLSLQLKTAAAADAVVSLTQPVGGDLSAAMQYAVDALIGEVFEQPGFCRSRLVYVKDYNGAKELWTADFDGGNPQQLTRNRGLSVEPCWGPTGRMLVYTHYGQLSTSIVLVDTVAQRQRRVTQFRGLSSGGALANDGRRLALTMSKDGNVELYVIAIEGDQEKRLTKSAGAEASPCWSPDDRRLCYVSDDRGSRPTLYLISAGGGRPERLLDVPIEAVSPDWSAVSNQICFATRAGGGYRIAVVDMSGRNREHRIVLDEPGDWEAPDWAGDGRHVVCSRNYRGQTSLYLVDTRLGRSRPLKNFAGDDTLPGYSVPR